MSSRYDNLEQREGAQISAPRAGVGAPRRKRLGCLDCGSHVLAFVGLATLAGQCGTCASYRLGPLS